MFSGNSHKTLVPLIESTKAFSYECVPKINFLISQPKHMLWALKKRSQ